MGWLRLKCSKHFWLKNSQKEQIKLNEVWGLEILYAVKSFQNQKIL